MNIKIKEAKKKDFDILILFRLKLSQHDSQLDSDMPYTIDKIQKSSKYMKEYLQKKIINIF